MKITIESLGATEELPLETVPDIIPNSCDVIKIGDVLDYVDMKSRRIILMELVTKLRFGGKLYIEGLDITQLAHSIVFGTMSVEEATFQIFNDGKKSASCLFSIVETLEGLGLDIEVSELYGRRLTVVAKRQSVE